MSDNGGTRPLPGALNLYVRLIVVAGGAVVVHSLTVLPRTTHLVEWFLFAVLAILTASFTIKIASVEASISVDDTFFITSALLFGPGPATVALAGDSCLLSCRKGHRWSRVAFNTVTPALSLWIAAQAFFLLSGIHPLAEAHSQVGPLIVPLLVLTAIYFALNSGLMAVAIGLEGNQSPLLVWRRHFLWLGLSYFAAASVALGLILIIQQVGLLAVAVILPVVAIFHRTLGASFGRLEDANRHISQMDRLYTSTVETLAMAIDAKDDVTHSHVRRVQAYAAALGRELGIEDEPTLKAIEAAALLHDTGKLGVPEHILNKPGGLTASEFEQMKRHVDIGADILSLVDFPFPVVPIVRCHHENWDGTGYPRGVAGEEIPIGARVLSVVDCFDALTSDRPYRAALSDEAALAILRERRGRMYDPRVVDAFIRIHRDVHVSSETAQAREVMKQIAESRHAEAPAPQSESKAHTADDNVLVFVSLARLASGSVGLADVLALSTGLVRRIVPGAAGAWYVPEDGARLALAGAFGELECGRALPTISVGDKLTGWVAANRRVIVNSDAALDLGLRAREAPALGRCLSVPLMAGDALAGVLTLYCPETDAFTEDHGRLIQMVAPHLAQAIQSAREQPVLARRFAPASRREGLRLA
jgi:putative nucleotidyltransferase with HDIG domain